MATLYVDNTKETGTLTGNNWQFTNASTTVTETGAAGNALAELAVNDYVRTNAGTQWYKVTAVTDDDNFEITPAFQQANNTDTCKYNDEDGSAIGQEVPHINAVTTDRVRAAGDIIKVRANQTHLHLGLDISFDESGTVNNYITLKGADSGDDPWSDGSDVEPIIDFGDTSFQILCSNDSFWKVQNLEIIQSADGSYAMQINASISVKVQDCIFRDHGTGGIQILTSQAEITNCSFSSNITAGLLVNRGSARVEGCTFNGGAATTDYGIRAINAGHAWVKDSTFGVTTAHDINDIRALGAAFVEGRNLSLASGNEANAFDVDSFIRVEDYDQTHLAYKAWYGMGIVSRSTVVERSGSGGTDWSMLGEPNSSCGSEQPLYIIGEWLRGVPIYLDGGSQTITVWAYTDSTGGGWTPDNTEFYIEIEHYEGIADWEIDQSAESFVAEDTWTSFSVTLTPGAAGVAYLRAIVKDNVAGAKLYIDPTPVFS
jgi:hypothetical protein